MCTANMHTCVTSSVIREIQVLATTKSHRTPTRTAKRTKTDTTKCRHICGTTRITTRCWQECTIHCTTTVETVWQVFLKKLNIPLPHKPEISLLGTCQRELRAYVNQKTKHTQKTQTTKKTLLHYSQKFLQTSPNQEQPMCPPMKKNGQTQGAINSQGTTWQ